MFERVECQVHIESRPVQVMRAWSFHVAQFPDRRVFEPRNTVAQYHNQYAVVGNPRRCPVSAAPQFVSPNGTLLPTPNGNFAADAMVSSIAHVLNGAFTNPAGTGWFDRYGLENSDKCQGTFGQTYTTPNGAQANMRINGRDLLIQQNWVNSATGKGYCGLSYP